MGVDDTQQQHCIPRQRPRRLTSISNLAKSLNLRRSHADVAPDEPLSAVSGNQLDKSKKRNLFTSMARKATPSQPTSGFQRSLTVSNIPRPVSVQKPLHTRLPSSKTSTALLPSRIPTPGGYGLYRSYPDSSGESRPASTFSRAQRRDKEARRQSTRSLLLPKIGPDGSVINEPNQEAQDSALDVHSIVRWSVENGPPTHETTPVKDIGLALSECGSSHERKVSRLRLKPKLNLQTNFSKRDGLKDDQDSPFSINTANSPRNSYDVVQRSLLHPVEPSSGQFSSSPRSPKDAPTSGSKDKGPAFNRLASSDSIPEASKGSPKSVNSRVKTPIRVGEASKSISNVKRLTSQIFSSSRPSVSTDGTSESEDIFDPTVSKEQPTAYWAGRFVSLQDRYLQQHFNDEFVKPPPHSNPIAVMRSKEVKRAQWIFEQLEKHCASKAAMKSLLHFKKAYALQKSLPELVARSSPRTYDKKEAYKSPARGFTDGINGVRNRKNSQSSSADHPVKAALTIPRKPLPANSKIFGPRKSSAIEAQQSNVGATANLSSTSLIQHDGSKSSLRWADKDRSFFGKLIDMGRKAA